MKKLAILILVTGTLTEVSAQQPKTYRYRTLPIPSDSLSKLMTKMNFSFQIPQAQFSHTLKNGDKVYLLPQDHMPCIVPDMSQYNYNMPVQKEKITGTIPNASPPQEIIPKKQ